MIRLERVTDALPAGFAALRTEARIEGHALGFAPDRRDGRTHLLAR